MKVTGSATLDAPVGKVWESILDPNVLVRTIPGCERLVETGENSYDMTVTAGVASIKGTYDGTVKLTDLKPHESLVLRADGAGAPGTIGVDVLVAFADRGDGTTQIDYDADAVVGGMIGGVGQRMLTSVSKRMSTEFFGNVNGVLTGQVPLAPAPGEPVLAGVGGEAAAPGAPRTFAAPAAAPRAGGGADMLTGIAIGAGIALLGVAVGAIVARRR